MDFLNRLLNRPSPKPAICNSSPKKQRHESVGEASQLTRPPVLASGFSENLEYETATSSSGPSSLAPESLSSASSFQSLASSVGSKSSSGICADSAPTSPEHHLQGTVSPALDATVIVQSESSFDNSYVNVNIPDLDDLISACARIDLGNSNLIEDEPEISLNQTFESATDDTTLVTPDESTLQTFKTCSGPAEFQTVQLAPNVPNSTEDRAEDVFKVPLPVNSQKSVVPYVAADSTLSKQNSDPDDVFKSALNSFSENLDRKHSLTPCVEIDVVEAARDKLSQENANQTFEVQEEEEEEEEEGAKTPVVEPEATENNKQLDAFALATPDATFEEVEAFNTTQTLETKLSTILEVDSQESIDVSSKTPEKSKFNALNQTEVISNNSDLKKEDNLAEDKSWKEQINKSIIEEAKSPRENALNKTNTLNQSKTPSKADSILQENIVSPKNDQIKTETPVQLNSREDELNRTNTFNQPKTPNKADNFIQENTVSSKGETPTKTDSNVNQELVISRKVDDIVDRSESPVQKEFISPIKKEFQEVVPSNKQLNNIYNSEVTSSTPLPNREIKKETPKTPKNRSNLFPSETNSAPSSPQALEKKPSILLECNNKENKTYFDETVAINKSSFDGAASELITRDNLEATNGLNDNSLTHLPEKEPEKEEDYEAFKPQQQSTSLPPTNFNFEKLQEAALDVAKDIDSSLEKFEEGEHFISATTELFEDPAAFDFLTQAGSQQPSSRGDRYDSLFMKFDPLAEKRLSMLSQKNNISTPPAEVEEDEKETRQNDAIGITPKKNPALAAIDRLLFDSPSMEGFNTKVSEEAKAKQKDCSEKPQSPLVSFVDEKMVKELELVRSSVLQLEEELERQKQEHKQQIEKQKHEYKQQLDKIKENCEDKITNVQTKLSDEIKCKDQMTVVVEEYEKSISRLIADREKDKSSLELEKARLQEELDLANQHLSNTEAAFSDVHSKYERLKKSVAAYRSNEAVLKESIAENQETIKTLENRYEQLKSHAMAQLEKANMELEGIRKQHDAESIKLKALLRKAELKSKSLEETVEQKMKENKELTKIIDEMIARVN